MSRVLNFAFLILLSFTLGDQQIPISKCKYPTHTAEYKGVEAVNKLQGQNFTADDESKKYVYYFRICDKPGAPEDGGSIPEDSGLVQYDKDRKKNTNIGLFTFAEVIQGSGWLLLKYENGDNYPNACGSTSRRASIMLMCPDDKVEKPVFRVIEENTNRKSSNCYYLFELEHPDVCTSKISPTTSSSKMSPLAICILIFVSCLILYLCVGMAYKRLAFGSRGWAMIPNNIMWQKIGARIADGCDWLCRCRNCGGSDRPYLPVDHPVHSTNNGNHYSTSPLPALVLAHDDLTAPGYNHFDITEQSQSNFGVSNLSSDEGDLYRDDQLLQA
jgi:hypothetical protein